MKLNGMTVISGFALNSNQPLDSRIVVSSKKDLNEFVSETGSIAYPGMIVYVNSSDADKGLYTYEGSTWKPLASNDAIALFGGTQITVPSGTEVDFNTYLTEGNYYIPSDDEMSRTKNAPTSKAGMLKVLAGTGAQNQGEWIYKLQIFISYNSTMYIRHYHKSPTHEDWSHWYQFAGPGQHISIHTGSPNDLDTTFSSAAVGDIVVVIPE